MKASFLFTKILDIGLVTVYYFLAATLTSILLDSALGPFKEPPIKSNKTADLYVIGQLCLEVIMQFFFIGVIIYAMRNVVEHIPFPLEGVGGFQHARLKEIDEAFVFIVVFMFYQKHLENKLYFLRDQLAILFHLGRTKVHETIKQI
jgi:hypothetical protein